MTASTMRSVHWGSRDYPLVLPDWRDPRLHLAAVIVTVHVLGQTVLGFRVSVPQIVVSILACAVIELVWTLRREARIVWPASAMLTGSGVALILRLVGMEAGQHWSWRGWHLFALVAATSLLSKYIVRWRGTHLFNPSNLGLVVAFLLLGSDTVEPLDFWWGPLGPGLLAAYVVIVAGGLLITRRLGLLAMGVAFWVALALFLGVLSGSGHCITVAWAFAPVCGADFWWVVISSPEVLIFLFFMITDPKTIPGGVLARISFAVTVALASALLIAPAQTEFGAKVGLLAGLVLLTPFRRLFDRLPSLATLVSRMTEAGRGSLFLRGAATGALLAVAGVGVVAAGAPARGEAPPAVAAVDVDVAVDPADVPDVVVSTRAAGLNSGVATDPSQIAVGLVQALAVEAEAMARSDPALLRTVSDGDRLLDLEEEMMSGGEDGLVTVARYQLDSLHVDVVYTDGPQGGASLAVSATGVVVEALYDRSGTEVGEREGPVDKVFVVRQEPGGRLRIVAELPAATGSDRR